MNRHAVPRHGICLLMATPFLIGRSRVVARDDSYDEGFASEEFVKIKISLNPFYPRHLRSILVKTQSYTQNKETNPTDIPAEFFAKLDHRIPLKYFWCQIYFPLLKIYFEMYVYDLFYKKL